MNMIKKLACSSAVEVNWGQWESTITVNTALEKLIVERKPSPTPK